MNFLMNYIIIPTVIPGGNLFFETDIAGTKQHETLILDIGLPLEPEYTPSGFELYTDAALYF
jgi:hypothetical protein